MSSELTMGIDWVKNKKMRKAVGSDLLLYGSAFVMENDNGSNQTRIPPGCVSIIIDKKPTPGPSKRMPKITGYQVNLSGSVTLYKPEHVWYSRLEHVSPPKKDKEVNES